MDYSNYPDNQSQPFSLYGLPTPDQQPQPPSDNGLRDPFSLNNYNQYFPGFDPSVRLDPSSSFVPPPHSPPDSYSKTSVSSNDPNNNTKPGTSSIDGDENQFGDSALGRSSSEEKESMTPAQTKRKAQNRAAQRAFRERKERHVKDLEDKVNSLEDSSTSLQADNERLKRQLAKYATENEILRATSHSLNGNNNGPPKEQPQAPVTGPMEYTPIDFVSKVTSEESGWVPHPGSTPLSPQSPQQHRITVCQVTGEKLLGPGATWDLIQNHELFKRGEVDIGIVTDKLKGLAQCDGQGPAFKEGQVRLAIEQSAAERDDLL
ncbi:unnamed protein product [Penicillium pancosmium]